jgi:protein-tyrosine phosphatase
MAEVVEWQQVVDPHSALRQVVRVLRGGGVVALPTEADPVLAADALAWQAVARLRETAGDGPLTLAVRGGEAARDWAPGMGRFGRRLARRFWPGPLALVCGDGVEHGAAGRLPEAVRHAICSEGRVRLRTPGHEAVLGLLERYRDPIVMVDAPDGAALVDLEVADEPGPYAGPTVVALEGESWSVAEPGAISAALLEQEAACLIVFVCTGNTCRSPLAEALFKKRLADQLGCTSAELPQRGYHVLSAGLAAMPGGPAAYEAVQVARSYGASLDGHTSRPLTEDLAERADFLVGMTRGHLEALAGQFPATGARPRLLSAAGNDLADPIGGPHEVYESCGRQIWNDLDALLAELRP